MAKTTIETPSANHGSNQKALWVGYFHLALSALISATTVAEWNYAVLVQKASSVADEALKTETSKTF